MRKKDVYRLRPRLSPRLLGQQGSLWLLSIIEAITTSPTSARGRQTFHTLYAFPRLRNRTCLVFIIFTELPLKGLFLFFFYATIHQTQPHLSNYTVKVPVARMSRELAPTETVYVPSATAHCCAATSQ